MKKCSCGKELSKRNKIGLCRTCTQNSLHSRVTPEQKAKAIAKITGVVKATPEYYLQNVLKKLDYRVDGRTLKHAMKVTGMIKDLSCKECGWMKANPYTGNIATEVDHINGDCTDNSPDNLRILCPNHHALKSTNSGLNVKRSRVVTV